MFHVHRGPQDGLREQDKEKGEKETVVMSGQRYENKKRELEQDVHSKQERIRARQRQG